ncbi:hypothetical protein HY522_08320 [bacterium]|nr:hypothetical protein [bacterium]
MGLGDPLVAPAATFLRRRQDPQFEKWDYPVNVYTLIETDEGRLLSLPPGTRRLSTYRGVIPDIIDRQIAVRFPRLLEELANRPNLFFPGVYFPREFDISNMEMISAMHGTFYVVNAELWVGHPVSVVLKPTDMALEAILTFILQVINRKLDPAVRKKIGPIAAPTIVAIDDVYGILELIPGKNGVEFLPRGIKTGTILDLRKNEYPADLNLTREESLQVAREFAKQAVMAYYLRLYDRKPDQIMIHRASDGTLLYAHIDFGRSLKRNYALPWKRHYDPSRPALSFAVHEIPYFEAAAAFIYLPHFIPAAFREELSPFAGPMRAVIVETFELLAREIKSEAEDIYSLLKYAIGLRTQYRPTEVDRVAVDPQDVEEVYASLLAIERPRDVIESILNLAYHEREGTAPIHAEDDGGVYRRALMLGDRVMSLADRTEEPHPYRLLDYRARGRISYDAEQKVLRIFFGEGDPAEICRAVERRFSRRLAEEIRRFPGSVRGVSLEIAAGGEVTARLPGGSAGGARLARRLRFPPDIMREINESASGFAPDPHVLARVAEFQEAAGTAVDDLQVESDKQRAILANDLEGKEILQFYMSIEPDGSPLRAAMAEMILYLISNPDFLADKDPYESINQLVLSLGRKHLPSLREPAAAFLSPELQRESEFVRGVLNLYESVDSSHFVHLVLTVRFVDELGTRAGLSPGDMRMLRTCAVLHDLNVLDRDFREVLMVPSGRQGQKIFTDVLDRHAGISAEILKAHLDDGLIVLPAGLSPQEVIDIVENHHRSTGGAPAPIRQILHLADNIAVFSDRTRPDHWNRGFLRVEEIAPRWIDAQLDRGQIDRRIWTAAQEFFSDHKNHVLLRRLDRLSIFYPQCYSALQMASVLHLGLNPQHPTPLADLRERHGAEVVDQIFNNLMKSGLSVRDKIKVINRIDAISSLFRPERSGAFAFINASAQPVQRIVELILRFVSEGRQVVLMGVLLRVIKTYERFRQTYPELDRAKREQVVVIAGVRRLQFVTHAYPIEAEFRTPFHRIIQTRREATGVEDPCCLIPFEHFMDEYGAAGNPEERVRKLEKASDVEEVPASDRVRSEAVRFLKWEQSQKNLHYDRLSKERFRRILLGGFTNRDVLMFYESTLQRDAAVRKALREIIGALHENPNFLSDRSVYYSIQELVRSLGKIHLHTADSATREVRAFLKSQGLSFCVDLAGIPDRLKPQLDDARWNLVSSLQIAVRIGRTWETKSGQALPREDWRLLVAGVLAAGALFEDGVIADTLHSPEDISANRPLRRQLMNMPVPIARLASDFLSKSGLSAAARDRLAVLFSSGPRIGSETVVFSLIQTGLIFGAYGDFSRVENWRRGTVQIAREDLEWMWEFIEQEFERELGRPTPVGPAVRDFCRTEGESLLNRMAGRTHSYLRLYNSLSLAAELRYGLKARGFDLIHHVRTLYGPDVTRVLTEAIMEANFTPRDKVKFARKLRILAQALAAEGRPCGRIRFLQTDHPLGFPSLSELRRSLQGPYPTLVVPAGDFHRACQLFDILRDRMSRDESRVFRRSVRVLVGEDYPLLIKEKSLEWSDRFRERIGAYRRRRRLSSRYIFVPFQELLMGDRYHPPAASPPAAGDKGLFYFRTWLRLFD